MLGLSGKCWVPCILPELAQSACQAPNRSGLSIKPNGHYLLSAVFLHKPSQSQPPVQAFCIATNIAQAVIWWKRTCAVSVNMRQFITTGYNTFYKNTITFSKQVKLSHMVQKKLDVIQIVFGIGRIFKWFCDKKKLKIDHSASSCTYR